MSDVGANCYVLRTNHRVQKWKCRGDVSMQARGIREFANRKRDERRFSEGVRVANDSEGGQHLLPNRSRQGIAKQLYKREG